LSAGISRLNQHAVVDAIDQASCYREFVYSFLLIARRGLDRSEFILAGDGYLLFLPDSGSDSDKLLGLNLGSAGIESVEVHVYQGRKSFC
jgi:hypothetical protein